MNVAPLECASQNTNNGPLNSGTMVEVIRRDAINRFAEAYELSLAFGRKRATDTC